VLWVRFPVGGYPDGPRSPVAAEGGSQQSDSVTRVGDECRQQEPQAVGDAGRMDGVGIVEQRRLGRLRCSATHIVNRQASDDRDRSFVGIGDDVNPRPGENEAAAHDASISEEARGRW
jgi:hypothetical protein